MQKQIGKIIRINGVYRNAANIFSIGPVSSAKTEAKIICPVCGGDMTYIKEKGATLCRICKRQIFVEEGLEFFSIVFNNGLVITMTYKKVTEARESQKDMVAQWAIGVSPPELLNLKERKSKKETSSER